MEYRVSEEDYAKHVDTAPFLVYLSATVILIAASVFVWPQLLMCAAVPLVMANLVGAPRQDRTVLAIMNVVFAFLAAMHVKQNKLFG